MAGVVRWGWDSQESSGGRAISPKAPCLRCRTARRSRPTWEVLGDKRSVIENHHRHVVAEGVNPLSFSVAELRMVAWFEDGSAQHP